VGRTLLSADFDVEVMRKATRHQPRSATQRFSA
jgi:hypothetical protein